MDATLSLVLFEAVLILLAIAISKAIRLISPLDDSCKDVVDSIPTVSSPSHIVAAPTGTKYDVFLSFRGEDTRDAFSSYLFEALCKANIHTFMDHKLHKGQHIAPVLLKTIEESEISLIIFSKDYASSTWCMDELVHIMKCMDRYGTIVIPVFYHVDPSNICKQNGSFGDGFAKLKFRFQHNNKKVQEWKNALVQSAKLTGWDSKNIRRESKLIKKIVEDILSKLNTKSSFHVEGLVGIDHQIQKIEKLLSEARIVGIWGIGGIGVLKERSLISVNKYGDIEMHALLMDMGFEISRQQLKSNPGKPIRLWRHEDIYHFFHDDKGIEDIRCLSLDLSKIRRRTAWRAINFQKMHNLIFLKVYKSDKSKPLTLTICDNLDYLPEELRFLSWEEYPFAQVPLNFCYENLITLRMPKSNIRQLWNGNQHFPNLKEIILWDSKHLTALPNLSHAPKIKDVNVCGCTKLDQIHSSTVLSNLYCLSTSGGGPRQINIGGSMKGTRSGLVMVYNYLDLGKSSWNKVRMKVLVCGVS